MKYYNTFKIMTSQEILWQTQWK